MEKLSEQIRQIQTDIENEQERIQQLENQRDRILNRNKIKERKERTHRLIERGAILEGVLPLSDFPDNQDVKKLLEMAFSTGEMQSRIGKNKQSR